MFEFPNTRRIVLDVLEAAGLSAGTRLVSLAPDTLPFHHVVEMPGSEQPRAPFATERFQIRTYAESPDGADDAAREARAILTNSGRPHVTEGHGQIDEIRCEATPAEIDTMTDTYAQVNAVYGADVRAL